jgi:hypothetical protein
MVEALDYTHQHAALDRVIGEDRPRAIAALRDYYIPNPNSRKGYLGSQFEAYDGGGDRQPVQHVFTDADLVALSFLGMDRAVSQAATSLADPQFADKATGLLRRIPTHIPIWQAEHTDVGASSPAGQLYGVLRSIGRDNQGFRPVTAAKLLARKRPHLLPVLDKEVMQYLDGKNAFESRIDAWDAMRTWFQLPGRRQEVQALREDAARRETTNRIASASLLRTIDVPIWMMQKGKV